MKFKRILSQLLLFVAILVVGTLAQTEVNDKCTIKHNGNPGVCKVDTNCPSALEKYKQGIRPTFCGFSGDQAILCCEVNGGHQQSTTVNNYEVNNETQTNLRNSERSIAKEQCAEYATHVKKKVVAIPLLPTSSPIEINVTQCDYSSVPLIVGGKKAEYGEFPHMVALGAEGDDGPEYKYKCGGTIIAENFVLTAAHCLRSTKFVTVRVGDLELNKSGETENDEPYNIDIERTFVHPDYKPPVKYNDIALVKLARSITFHKNVRPACLWTEPNFQVTKTIATGWGVKQVNDVEEFSELRQVVLDIFENSRCANYSSYKTGRIKNRLPHGIIDSQMCAGDITESKDTCQGDSGGPIVVTDQKTKCIFYVVGVTSFGLGCGNKIPAIYSRVSSYVPWIESIVWPN